MQSLQAQALVNSGRGLVKTGARFQKLLKVGMAYNWQDKIRLKSG